MVFDCEKSKQQEALVKLKNIYDLKQAAFPLNLRICLMPMLGLCCTGESANSFHKYTRRHRDFTIKLHDYKLNLFIKVPV